MRKRPRSGRMYGRSNSKRKALSFRRPSRIRASLGNFSSTKTVALRYVDNFTLDASGTGSAVHVFSVNSIFDPNVTGTGHQPMFHDNYQSIYGKYRVNYATITVVPLATHITNTTTANQLAGTNIGDNQFFTANQRGCRLWILRDESQSDYPSNLDTLIEEGSQNFVWRYCPQNTSQKMPILRFSAWPHKVLNVDRKDDTIQSVFGLDPIRPCYFIVGCSSIGASTNPDPLIFQTIITYNVTFSDLIKNQAQQ